ncbi:MAG: InlB B-repeat-containing protein, partial [Treponema sp.]|nr:InlB B-repeat-containing protein [Treponema sp.]
MKNTGQVRLVVVFCVGLLLFTGCKDLFHSEESEPVYYTVTFNADGGSPSTQTRTVESGDTVGSSNMPSNPARNGYTFGGWYTERNGSGSPFTYSSSVNHDITVYAQWTSIQYTVTFDADGGSPATETRKVTNGSSVGSSNMPSEPTRSGYTFGGWYTEQNGSGSSFTYSSTVNGNMTVYANWTISQYTVTFDADGGNPPTQSRGVNSSGSIGSSNMPSEPTRDGYIFTGWYTEANSGGSEFTGGTTVTENIT